MATKTTDRKAENQRRIASYAAPTSWYVNADGIRRRATEEDYRNTLKAEGFELDDDQTEGGN